MCFLLSAHNHARLCPLLVYVVATFDKIGKHYRDYMMGSRDGHFHTLDLESPIVILTSRCDHIKLCKQSIYRANIKFLMFDKNNKDISSYCHKKILVWA